MPGHLSLQVGNALRNNWIVVILEAQLTCAKFDQLAIVIGQSAQSGLLYGFRCSHCFEYEWLDRTMIARRAQILYALQLLRIRALETL